MEFRTLDKLGIKTSLLGFGCMRLPMNGDKVDYDEFNKMIGQIHKADVKLKKKNKELNGFIKMIMKKL